jgi:hypothetical protein
MNNVGATYIFERQTDGTHSETQKLVASDGEASDKFGKCLWLGSDRIVVGAVGADSSQGRVYVFELQPDGTYAETQILEASNKTNGDEFGRSVSSNGSILLVGARRDAAPGTTTQTGTAYVFELEADGTYSEVQILVGSDSTDGDRFGTSVAISGDLIVVGSPESDYLNLEYTGAAYVFERQTDGSYIEVAKLWAPLTGSETASDGGQFGRDVSIDGALIVIGADNANNDEPNSGAAYVFERLSDGTFVQTQKLGPGDPDGHARFGRSVSLDGERLIVGANEDDSRGAAYIFERQASGEFSETQKIVANDGSHDDMFGCDVAISGDTLVIGAERDDDIGDSSGSAYIHTFLPLCTKQGTCICKSGYGGADCGAVVTYIAPTSPTGGAGENVLYGNYTIENSIDLANLEGYTEITGQLVINSSGLPSLVGLEALQIVHGPVYIWHSHGLIDLNGLSGLTTVGGLLEISSNNKLTSLAGLSSLTSVHGNLTVTAGNEAFETASLPKLSSVTGTMRVYGMHNSDAIGTFPELTSVGHLVIENNQVASVGSYPKLTSVGSLMIESSPNLSDLKGLEALAEVNWFRLKYVGISSLEGLSGLNTVGGACDILECANLTDLSGMSSLTSIGGSVEWTGNDILCQSVVDAFLATVTVGGSVTTSGNNGVCP